MKQHIKEYWNNLKSENTHTNAKEKFKLYLEALLKENPKNVDAVCALAMTIRETKYGNEATPLLEDFIRKYETELSPKDRARIYTNLAFYCENYEEEIEYLQKAEELNSPFMETYEGLGLYYFTKFKDTASTEYGAKSLNAFKKAVEIDNNNYEMRFGYAVCLFELKEYEKAKEEFENLLQQYPNRMKLLLCIAYCEVYLGNKENALYYLKQIKVGRDENYDLSIDEIADFQIYDAYYVLGECELFIEEFEKNMDWSYATYCFSYYYALWITNEYQKLDEVIENHKKQILYYIEVTKADEDFDDEIGQEHIESYYVDLDNLIEIEHKIKNENYKPVVNLHLEPEYGCYLIDCMRHKF